MHWGIKPLPPTNHSNFLKLPSKMISESVKDLMDQWGDKQRFPLPSTASWNRSPKRSCGIRLPSPHLKICLCLTGKILVSLMLLQSTALLFQQISARIPQEWEQGVFSPLFLHSYDEIPWTDSLTSESWIENSSCLTPAPYKANFLQGLYRNSLFSLFTKKKNPNTEWNSISEDFLKNTVPSAWNLYQTISLDGSIYCRTSFKQLLHRLRELIAGFQTLCFNHIS